MLKYAPLLLAMVTCTVVGNVLLKTGAVAGLAQQQESPALVSRLVIGHLINWHVALGIVSFGLAFGLYIISLRYLPLNLVQSIATAQFVGTILASSIILSETIEPARWVGIGFITVGMLVVGGTAR